MENMNISVCITLHYASILKPASSFDLSDVKRSCQKAGREN